MVTIDIRPFPKDCVSLYFHIPFCTKKCDYCHFYVLPDKQLLKEQYMQTLRKEWQMQLPLLAGKKIASIYFGGGTPYLLGPKALDEVLTWVRALPFAQDDIEITLEANPENVTLETMHAYRQVGINRISIDLQSLDDSLLQTLGRQHNAKKSLEAIEITVNSGISNISIDLMYDLPRQTLGTWENTLKQIVKLPITHLSLYNLTIEPHTVFFKYRDSLGALIPNQEDSLAMYQMAIAELQAAELQQYEISAFCRGGQYAQHNVGYWNGRAFLGFGPSAFSYWEGRRFRNIANLSKYAAKLEAEQSPIDFDEKLDDEAQKRELLAIGLRLLAGVTLDVVGHETRQDIDQLVNEGYVRLDGRQLSLTAQGVLFYDDVATALV